MYFFLKDFLSKLFSLSAGDWAPFLLLSVLIVSIVSLLKK